MNADYRLKTIKYFIAGLIAISVAGCAGSKAYKRGTHADATKDFDTAMAEYKIALDKDPKDIDIQLKYNQARYNAAFQHFEAGRRAVDKQDFETAKMESTRVLEIDPSHALAEQQLQKVNEILAAKNRNQAAPEIQYDQLRESTRTDPTVASQLDAKITAPIDLHMVQDSKVAFESLATLAGLNVIFDPDFRGTRISIDLDRVSIFDALDILAL